MTKCFSMDGNIRRDLFGRIVVDTCLSDKGHLTTSEALPGDDRARCRVLLESFFEQYLNKKGRLNIEVTFREEFND